MENRAIILVQVTGNVATAIICTLSFLSTQKRRNLGSIAKVLQHAAACKLVSFVFENFTVLFFDIYMVYLPVK